MRVNGKKVIYHLQDKCKTLGFPERGNKEPSNFSLLGGFLIRKFLFGTEDEVVPRLMDVHVLITVLGSIACKQAVGQLSPSL